MDFLWALGSLFKGWRVTTWISTPLRLLVLLPLGTAESYPIKIAGRSQSFLEGNKRAPKSKGETILNGLPSFMDFSSVMARIIRQSSAIPTLVNVRGPWCTPPPLLPILILNGRLFRSPRLRGNRPNLFIALLIHTHTYRLKLFPIHSSGRR